MKPLFRTVMYTGLLVGTTDLIAAYINQFILTGKFADKLLQYIAGGALGLETSLQGGLWTSALGLFFHYFIATAFTFLFFLIYPKFRLQAYNVFLVGFLYGVFVGMVMGFVVLPLTPLPKFPFDLTRAAVGWCILGVALGIPMAVIARRFYRQRHTAA